MAYVSHSGTNNTSQYDWKVLIFMVLLLAAILVFVAAKFIYPEMVKTSTVVPAQAMSNTSTSSAPKSMVKTDAAAVISIAEKKEVIPPSAPKVIVSTVDSAPSSSTIEATAPAQKLIAPTTQSDINQPALVSSEANTQSEDLRCSDSDHTAGLCK
jgi:hypothetical protein